jgi:hypothetical protein
MGCLRAGGFDGFIASKLARVPVCGKKWTFQKQQSPRISTRALFCMVRHQESNLKKYVRKIMALKNIDLALYL